MSTLGQALTWYDAIRQQTIQLCDPLMVEDYVIQGMVDVSPPKWHLAHTTWFFETLILMPHVKNYQCFDSKFQVIFNSYYQSINKPSPRCERGLLSRPTVNTVYQYRQYVDEHMHALFELMNPDPKHELMTLLTIGLHHEQQHQELLMTDIKYNFSIQPGYLSYQRPQEQQARALGPIKWIEFDEVLTNIGAHVEQGFSYDAELPRHRQFLEGYALCNRLITNAEYLAFMDDGGYDNPAYWLADGWDKVQINRWRAPLYWRYEDEQWFEFTLQGLQPLQMNVPVVHVSYYEADAYARWSRKRLPTEHEWEHGGQALGRSPSRQDNFLEEQILHPSVAGSDESGLLQFFGDVWEWTMSPFISYPGVQRFDGPLNEYNGKFMCNQWVLRGGCCVTPRSHVRLSYRNFYPPHYRNAFSGIRLAADLVKGVV